MAKFCPRRKRENKSSPPPPGRGPQRMSEAPTPPRRQRRARPTPDATKHERGTGTPSGAISGERVPPQRRNPHPARTPHTPNLVHSITSCLHNETGLHWMECFGHQHYHITGNRGIRDLENQGKKFTRQGETNKYSATMKGRIKKWGTGKGWMAIWSTKRKMMR